MSIGNAHDTFEDLHLHRQRLQQILDLLVGRSDVEGVLLGGSFAYGKPDEFSDIDLYIVTTNDQFEQLFRDHDSIAQTAGSVVSAFIADHNPGGEYDYIVLYEDLVKVDFMYVRLDEMRPSHKWARCRLLFDRRGRLQQLHEDSAAPPAPEAEATAVEEVEASVSEAYVQSDEVLCAVSQKFRAWCWYAFGKLMRGELWEALEATNVIRSRALLPMIYDLIGGQPEGYRRLESKMSQLLGEQLRSTVGVYQEDSIYRALQNEIRLFFSLEQEVFARRNLSADVRGLDRILCEIERVMAQRGKPPDKIGEDTA